MQSHRRRLYASTQRVASKHTPRPPRGGDPARARPTASSLSSSPAAAVETLEGRLFLHAAAAIEHPADGNLIVKFAAGVGGEERRNIIASNRLTQRGEIAPIGVDLLSVADGESAQAVAKRLKANNPHSIEYAEVDALVAPSFVPDDPLFPDQ